MMNRSWVQKALPEVISLRRGYDLPIQRRREGSIPVVGSFGITGSHAVARERGPGVTIGRSGASMGTATYVEQDYWPLNTTLFVTDFKGNDPRWCFWALKATDFSSYNSGSAQPSLNRNLLGTIQLLVPPLPVQRRIAAVLGALDDLIETNERLCESASSLVRTYFQSVLGDLRPELKPEWGLGTFTDLVDVIGGGTPNTGDTGAWGGDIPWYSVVDAPEPFEIWCIDTEKSITSEGLSSCSARLLPVGATIISARGTVGRLALVGVPMAFNQSCYGLVSRFDAPVFTYFATEALVGQLQRMAHGSVFSTITRSTLDAVPTALPPASVVKDFESQVSSMAEAIRGYLTENMQLRRTRDELLPLLLSGRVSPGEVDLDV